MVSVEQEPIMGQRPQRYPGAESWSGGQRASSLKLNAFLYYHNLRSRLICHEICFFFANQKSRWTFGSMAPTAPWIDQWSEICDVIQLRVHGFAYSGVQALRLSGHQISWVSD